MTDGNFIIPPTSLAVELDYKIVGSTVQPQFLIVIWVDFLYLHSI